MLEPPDTNLAVFKILYNVENVLRELIREMLDGLGERNWYKKRMPEAALEKYKEGIRIERTIRWIQLVPHHPLYYIDFPHIREIIERKDNWNDAFRKVFRRKEVISGALLELEPIRNRLAHNRKISEKDVQIAKASYEKVRNLVGSAKFESLAERNAALTDIRTDIEQLLEEAKATFANCRDCRRVNAIPRWSQVSREWWFDESYLGISLHEIDAYFRAVERYMAHPRHRGVGHILQQWLADAKLDDKFQNCSQALARILEEWSMGR